MLPTVGFISTSHSCQKVRCLVYCNLSDSCTVRHQHKRQLQRLMIRSYLEDSLKQKDLLSQGSKNKYHEWDLRTFSTAAVT